MDYLWKYTKTGSTVSPSLQKPGRVRKYCHDDIPKHTAKTASFQSVTALVTEHGDIVGPKSKTEGKKKGRITLIFKSESSSKMDRDKPFDWIYFNSQTIRRVVTRQSSRFQKKVFHF